MNKIECTICYCEYSSKLLLTCPACQFQCCTSCMKQTISSTEKTCCPNPSCKIRFTQKFLIENLGRTFYTSRIRKLEEDVLFREQQALLHSTQGIATWEREYRRQKQQQRFGIRMTIGPRPKYEDSLKIFFPCPQTNCRGFIEPGNTGNDSCPVCQTHVCLMCREQRNETHVCDPNILSNIAMLSADSKPCPSCGAQIQRSEGCNHMFCTHCRTHFHWGTGKILTESTNGHYNHLPNYARDLVRRTTTSEENEDTEGTGTERSLPCLIPTDLVLREHFAQPELYRTLYYDADVIRVALQGKYQVLNAYELFQESLVNLRVEYLLGDITESRWKSRIYSITKQYERDSHVSNVLSFHLQTVIQFQMLSLSAPLSIMRELISGWIVTVNASLLSLNEEFGGVIVRIRNIDESDDTPPLLC